MILPYRTIFVRTVVKEKSSCDSRVPSQCTEEACRHRISSQDRFFRMEAMGKSLIDLFASRVPHQLSIYVAWRKDSYSAARNTFSITWNKEFYYAFPSFYLITQVLNQIKKDKTKKIILITSCWQTLLWYPQILSMLIRKPVILPLSEKLLTNPSGQTHPLVTNQIFTLVT